MVETRDDAGLEGPGKNSGFLHQKNAWRLRGTTLEIPFYVWEGNGRFAKKCVAI